MIPESDGRLLISDFGGSPPYVRMTRDGVVAGGFEPKDADGQVIGTAHGMRAAPDGHLWISDGHALQRLSKTGVIDRILGEGLQPTRLGPIAGIVSDPRGRMYAIDSRTGSIHVFDESGNLLHVCQAKPTDFKHEILFSVPDRERQRRRLPRVGAGGLSGREAILRTLFRQRATGR